MAWDLNPKEKQCGLEYEAELKNVWLEICKSPNEEMKICLTWDMNPKEKQSGLEYEPEQKFAWFEI